MEIYIKSNIANRSKYEDMELNEKIINCLGIYNKLSFEELHNLLFKTDNKTFLRAELNEMIKRNEININTDFIGKDYYLIRPAYPETTNL